MHSFSLYFFDGLLKVRDQVFLVLQTAAQADQVGTHAGGVQLFIGHLPVGGRGRMQAAGAGISNMGLDGAKLQVLHKDLRSLPSALQTEGNDAAGAARQVLLGKVVILIGLKTAVAHPGYLGVGLQILCNGLGILTMLTHTEGQAFQTQIQIVSTLGGLDRTQIPHQLGSAFGDERAGKAKTLGIGDTVIALVGGAQAGELVGVLGPVEFAAVHNAAAYRAGVAIHILGGGVGDNVRAPLKGTAVDGGGEGVIHDQRHAVGVGSLGKTLDVQHCQGRIGDGLAEHSPGVGTEGGFQLLIRAVGVDKGGVDAHALHGDTQQIEAAAVDGGAGHDMIAAGSDIKQSKKGGSLAGAGEHGGSAALQSRDLGGDHVTGGVLQTGVEIALSLQIKELAHILGGGIFEGGALVNGDLPGLAVFRAVAGLDAQGFGTQFLVHRVTPQNQIMGILYRCCEVLSMKMACQNIVSEKFVHG